MCTQLLVSQMKILSTLFLCSPPRLHGSQACHFHVRQIRDLKHELCFPSANAGHPRNARTRSAQHLGDWMSKIVSISDDPALAWKIGFTGKSVYEVRHEVGWLISLDTRASLLSVRLI